VETRLEKKRFFLNVQQKSAEGIVVQQIGRRPNDRRGKYVARLKGAKRQNNQLQLAFEEATTSEARSQSSEGTEASVAECSAESLAPDEQWMERICQRENLWQALKRVKKKRRQSGHRWNDG